MRFSTDFVVAVRCCDIQRKQEITYLCALNQRLNGTRNNTCAHFVWKLNLFVFFFFLFLVESVSFSEFVLFCRSWLTTTKNDRFPSHNFMQVEFSVEQIQFAFCHMCTEINHEKSIRFPVFFLMFFSLYKPLCAISFWIHILLPNAHLTNFPTNI